RGEVPGLDLTQRLLELAEDTVGPALRHHAPGEPQVEHASWRKDSPHILQVRGPGAHREVVHAAPVERERERVGPEGQVRSGTGSERWWIETVITSRRAFQGRDGEIHPDRRPTARGDHDGQDTVATADVDGSALRDDVRLEQLSGCVGQVRRVPGKRITRLATPACLPERAELT